jgi:hypothetical protein
MIRKRGILAVAAMGASVVLAFAGPASAAEGTWTVSTKSGNCNVLQEVELQGSPQHDYMMWATYEASDGCQIVMYDNGEIIEHQNINDVDYHHSAWYYDGPGHSIHVCAYDLSGNEEYACGPLN